VKLAARLCLLVVACHASPPAWAQSAAGNYPNKPVRLVVPFSAGASTDIVARLLGGKLAETWGQQFIADNRPGAAGALGAEAVARATPDGYTLMVTNPGPSINNILLKSRPLYTFADFAPVIYIASAPIIAVANPKFPPNDVKELVAYARANPGKVTWGSSGPGSNPHAGLETLKAVTGVNITHVPYKGTAGYMPDLLSGRVEFMFAPMANVLQQAQSGKLRALAVTSSKRVAALPELPTVMEEGVPGYQAMSWYLLLAPAKTPAPIVGKLAVETTKLLKLPEVQKRMAREGADAAGGTAAEALRFLQDETALWGKVIRSANIKAE